MLNYEKQTPWANIPLIQPKFYKEMKRYAKYLLKNKHFFTSIYWYYKYSISKFKYLINR